MPRAGHAEAADLILGATRIPARWNRFANKDSSQINIWSKSLLPK
jgi:hypothetical protein